MGRAMDQPASRPDITEPAWLTAIARWRWPLALLAGALAALGMEPWSQPLPALGGLVLLILLLALRPTGEAFRIGLLFGFAHFAIGLSWIATAFTYQSNMPAWLGWVAVAGLALFLATYPAIAAWAARTLTGSPVPLGLAFSGLFALTEILRGALFSGFAWNPLGAVWLPVSGMAQFAAFVGANGLSALALLVASGGAALLLAPRGHQSRGLAVAILALTMASAVMRPGAPSVAAGAEFLLVQTGTRIDDKHAPGGLQRSLAAAVAQTRAALAEGPPPAAVIWPEATVEYPMEENPGLRRQLVTDFQAGTLLLTGGVAVEYDANGMATGARNSLYALDYQGNILARYDKAHLVPGGEYLPLRRIAEPLGLSRLVPGTLDFLPGPGPVSWAFPGLPMLSPNICYEIIFPGAVVRRDKRPDAIVTVSNDAWFGASGPPQHHAQARLRAIEEALPVLRVTPTGLTGLIDADGRMRATLPRGPAAVLRVRLPEASPPTLFSQAGLTAPGLLTILLLGLGGWLEQRGRQERKT